MRSNGVPERADHRRRLRLGEVRGLGGHGAAHAAQPALPLDAPRAEASRSAFATGCSDPDSAREIYDALQRAARRRRFHDAGAAAAVQRASSSAATDDPSDSLEHHRALRARAQRRAPGSTRPGAPTRRWRSTTRRRGTRWVGQARGGGGHARSAATPSCWRRSRSATTSSTSAAAGSPITASSGSTPTTTPSARCEAAFDQARARDARSTALGGAASSSRRCSTTSRCMDHARGWVQQFHLGALRNNNTRALQQLGPDTGFDSIGDFAQARPLARFLDRLDAHGPAGQDHPLQPEPARQRAVWPR